MKKMVPHLFLLLGPPCLWCLASIVLQLWFYNPIGNGYIRYELERISECGIYFIGPSTFHSRIDCNLLSQELNVPVHNISFDGMNTMEVSAIADYIEANAKEGIIVIAGQHMSGSVPGFHNCWACSHERILEYGIDSELAKTCLLFDMVAGPIAGLAPVQKTRDFKDWQEFDGISDSTLIEFNTKLKLQSIIEKPDFYSNLIREQNNKSFLRVLVIPPNGRFRECPNDIEHTQCLSFANDSWLSKELWKDGAHTSFLGTDKFNNELLYWIRENDLCLAAIGRMN